MTASPPAAATATTTTTTTTTEASSGGAPDRAARTTAARLLIHDAAASWLTDTVVTGIGQAVTLAINRYRPGHGQPPTWAEALTGVDPALLTPITMVPPGWPLPPAAWRRDLRTRMMARLKHARWVTYSTQPRSLRIGPRGRAWLTATGHHPQPEPPARPSPPDRTAAPLASPPPNAHPGA